MPEIKCALNDIQLRLLSDIGSLIDDNIWAKRKNMMDIVPMITSRLA